MICADDIDVRIVYRDRERNPVCARTYTLREYTEMLRADLLRVITDVEDMCYAANRNKPKEDWSDETFSGFNKIKHKILDKAGDIGRLPDSLCERDRETVPLTDFVAGMIEKGEMPSGEGRMGQKDGRRQRG